MKTIDSATAAASLAKLRRDLEKSTDLKEIIDIHVQVETLLFEIKTSALGAGLLYQADELKLLTECKAGRILPNHRLHGGDRRSSRHTEHPKLASWGVTRSQAHQWRKMGKLSAEEVADYFSQASRQGEQPTSNALFQLARARAETERLARGNETRLGPLAHILRDLANQGKRFACIYADTFRALASGTPSSGLRIDPSLVQLPVMEVAAPVAHLYLKVAPWLQEEGKKVLRAWGFSWEASLVRTGLPPKPDELLQPVCDVVLLGVRGSSGRDNQGLPHWIEGSELLNVRSDEALLHFIEKVSQRPYLDLFGSLPLSKDWTMAASRRIGFQPAFPVG